MRIRIRIALGFALVIALTVVVGAVGVVSLESYAQRVARVDAASRVAMGFGDVKLVEARMLDGDPSAAAAERDLIARLSELAGDAAGADETRAALTRHRSAFALKAAARRELAEVSRSINASVDQLDAIVARITAAQIRRARQTEEKRRDAVGEAAAARAVETTASTIRLIVTRARTLQAGGDFDGARSLLNEIDEHLGGLPADGLATVAEAISRYRDRLSFGAVSGLDLGSESRDAIDATTAIQTASEEEESRAAAAADAAGAAQREATALTDRGRRLSLAAFQVRLLVTRILSGEVPPEDEVQGITARIAADAGIIGAATGDEDAKNLVESTRSIDTDVTRLARAVLADKTSAKTMLDASAALTRAVAVSAETELRAAGEGKARATMISLVAALAAAAVGLLMALLIGRSIARGIAALTARMRGLAEGAIEGAIPFLNTRGELGLMAGSVAVFQENERSRVALEREMAAARERAERERRETLDGLAAEWEGRLGEVVRAVNDAAVRLAGGAEGIAGLARETGLRAGQVARDTGQATVGVHSLASAADQLASSIAEISRSVGEAADEVRSGEEGAARAQTDVSSLSSAADGVGEIVVLIAEIASRTNLLALNATIEAARAGEAGKGFAVVANEVKALAAQTSRAANEIAARISSIRDETTRTVGTIDRVREVMERIGRATATVAQAIEQQRLATGEIARVAQTVADNAEDANRAIGTVEGAAVEVGRNAADIRLASEVLTVTGGDLALTSEKLFQAMRAV